MENQNKNRVSGSSSGRGSTVDKKSTANGTVEIPGSLEITWDDSVTVLDLSNRKIDRLDVKLPTKLLQINISHNLLVDIPSCVMKLNNLKILNASYNRIKYFDDVPCFVQSIESLNLASNALEGPPCWVWTESPPNLMELNLCDNMLISNLVDDSYLEELLQYKSLVTCLKFSNCALKGHLKLLQSFPNLKTLKLGTPDFRKLLSNSITQVPCEGLDCCCDIERLNLSNVQLYSIEKNIDMYKKLTEIDLSHNNINDVPNEFCNLECLEICILSDNRILYLPEEFTNLKNLKRLHLDGNELCMLPKDIGHLPNLKTLDIYDNRLYEVTEGIKNISELDLALNYFDEPDDGEYLVRKERLRLYTESRFDGRKTETPPPPDSYYSNDTTDDDEDLINTFDNCSLDPPQSTNPPSSPEDWDSDDYWVPIDHFNFDDPKPGQAWLAFVKKKMAEGSFCPMDVHPVSVSEQVQYEKMCNPKVWTEVSGQFDDTSEEES